MRWADVAEWAAIFAIVAGIWTLAGTGWALIAIGVLALLNLTADAWLPALSTRHGRRHGTDSSSRNS